MPLRNFDVDDLFSTARGTILFRNGFKDIRRCREIDSTLVLVSLGTSFDHIVYNIINL